MGIINRDSSKKKVVILATGGTIAGVGEEGKTAGYKPGALRADEIISAIPELSNGNIDIEGVQICNVNSDDITDSIWISLANEINTRACDDNVAGFVITHGTDTLEETAYFLNLTVKTDKPVVLTGSMRPASSLSADGPMNLYEAVTVASSKEAIGEGVLVVFSDRIFSARTVTKLSTYNVNAISAGELGALGVVRDGNVYMYESSRKIHTTQSKLNLYTNKLDLNSNNLNKLPKVSIIYFSVDADPELLEYAAKISDGLVIAGAGAGEFSNVYKDVIEKLDIPVVISSRTGDGIILPENLLCKNTIAADNLPPQKAAILLRLAIANGIEKNSLQELFLKY